MNISNINSLATVTWEDFISQVPHFRNCEDKRQLAIIKVLGVAYAVLIMGVGFLVGMLSGVIESYMLMTSATSGPLLGVFLLAMLVPAANWKGAATGVIIAHLVAIWMIIGKLSIHQTDVILPTSIEGCNNVNISFSESHLMRLSRGDFNDTTNIAPQVANRYVTLIGLSFMI